MTRFCHLNIQTSLGRTPRKRASLFSPISSRFDGCCILRARSRHSTCISGLSLERYCARIVFARYRSDASLSIGTSPTMSVSLSLTPGVATDWPVTPNDFLVSSVCRGSASQVMPSAVHSTILSNTRMLCIHSREARSLLRVPKRGAVSPDDGRCTVMFYLARSRLQS